MTEPGSLDLDFGRVAVFNDLISQQQLDECLSIQADMAGRGYPMFLGKILIKKHYIDRISVAAILKAISAGRGGSPVDVDTRINLIRLTEDEHRVLLARSREGRLLPVERIDHAYDVQSALERHGIDEQLGEILLAQGHLSPEVIDDILRSIQEKKEGVLRPADGDRWETAVPLVEDRPAPAPAPAPDKRFLFGQLAIEKNLLTADQVRKGLAAQRRMSQLGIQKRLGEVLVARRELREPDVRRILALQKERYGRISRQAATKAAPVRPEDAALGQTLLERRLLSQQELVECQYIQRELLEMGVSQTLGEILVERGYLEADVVEGLCRPKATPAEAAPRMGRRRVRSKALSDSYRSVMKDLGVDEDHAGDRRVAGAHARRKEKRRLVLATAGTAAIATTAIVLALLTLAGRGTDSPAGPEVEVAATPGDPDPTPGRRDLSDASAYRARIASIDGLLDEWRFAEASKASDEVLRLVAGRTDREAEVAERLAAARALDRWSRALVAAIQSAAPVTARLEGVGECRVVDAGSDGLAIQNSPEDRVRIVRWSNAPPADVVALAAGLGLDAADPLGTLHYVVRRNAGHPVDAIAGAAIAADPAREEEVRRLVARHLGLDDPSSLVLEGGRLAAAGPRERDPDPEPRPGEPGDPDRVGPGPSRPPEVDLDQLEALRAKVLDHLFRHEYDLATALAREGIATIGKDVEASRRFRWFLEGAAAEAGLHAALRSAIAARAARGRPLELSMDGRAMAVESAGDGGLTLRLDHGTVQLPWSRVDGPKYLALLSGLRAELGNRWIEVAGAFARRGRDVDAMDLLVSLHGRDEDARRKVETFLVAWQGLDGVPAGGFVASEGALIPAGERDRATAEARTDEAELEEVEAGPETGRADRILAHARSLLAGGKFELGHRVLRQWSREYPDHPEAEDVERMAGGNALLSVRLERGSGPSSNRVDFLLCGDGYVLDDARQKSYATQARRVIEGFLRVEPFKEYGSYLKFHVAHCVSEEEEISIEGGEQHSSLFRAFRSRGGQVVVDNARTRSVLAGVLPEGWDNALVMVRRGHLGTGGGGVAAFAEGDVETAIHESGHSFVGLCDEYVESSSGLGVREFDFGPNLTTSKDLARCPWRHWIEAGTRGVGFHEGGGGRPKGVWRPTSSGCIMGVEGSVFCVVCREAAVLAIYRLVRPVDRAEPDPTDPVRLEPGARAEVVLRLAVLQPATHALEVAWTIDGERPRGARFSRSQDPRTKEWIAEARLPASLFEGHRSRLVTAKVHDPTPWVKKDEEGLLTEEVRWTIEGPRD